MFSSRWHLAEAKTESEQRQSPQAAAPGWGGRAEIHQVGESQAECHEIALDDNRRRKDESPADSRLNIFFQLRTLYGFLLDQTQESGVKEKSSWVLKRKQETLLPAGLSRKGV